MLKYSLGIDMSAKDFHCCISSINEKQEVKIIATGKFLNTRNGFGQLSEWIEKHRKDKQTPFVVIMEATGVYYENCAYYLSTAGYYVSVVLPNKAKNYLRALGLKSKNDKIDAKGLSRMGAEQSLDQWQPLSKFYFTLRAYTRQHQSLQELKTSVSNQLHAAEHTLYQVKEVTKQLRELISKIDKQILQLKKKIEDYINSDKEIRDKVEKCCSIKGVGVMTMAVILGETNGFALFKSVSQLISYTGYDVVDNQSGKHQGKTKISKRGNAKIRRILFMPAFNVIRYDVKPFVELFKRTFERHKIKMKSYVALQKKLLVVIYSLWKNNQFFDPNRLVHKENSPGNAETTQGKQLLVVS